MNGLDKIISQIEEDAKNSADIIIGEAKKQAEAILSEADEICRKTEEEAEQKCKALHEDILNKTRSSARMQQKRALLGEKQKLISEVIEEAKSSLYELDGKEYFTLIVQMLDKYVRAGAGEIFFNRRDLDRLPEGFEQTIHEAAQKKGGQLSVGKEPKSIDGGFLLVYGGVEENCSFASIFADNSERLQDRIQTLLFG